MNSSPIGLFDSGLGGLTVLQAVRTALPAEGYVYLGDSARTPWGTKGKQTVVRYSRECAQFLCEQGVKALVVACNTASSLALEELREDLSIPVIGTIECAAARAVEVTRNGIIGVIGTEATIQSEAYNNAILRHDSAVRVHAQACPLFVPLVEQGMHSGEIVEKIVELYLAPLRGLKVDTVVLGCTHYPLLSVAIQRYLGEDVSIVECSLTVAEELKSVLDSASLRTAESVRSGMCYVTDELSRFKSLASLLVKGEQLQVVQIHPLDDVAVSSRRLGIVRS